MIGLKKNLENERQLRILNNNEYRIMKEKNDELEQTLISEIGKNKDKELLTEISKENIDKNYCNIC